MRGKGRRNRDETQEMIDLSTEEESEILDFSCYSIGDSLDKRKIATVIFKSEPCIVFIDQDRKLAWLSNLTPDKYAKDFGTVMGRVDLLLSTPDDLLTLSQQEAFRRLIGGAIARLLDDAESSNANSILDKAEAYLRTRTTERARIWFLSSALLIAGMAVLIGVVLVVFRTTVQSRIGITAFEVSLATLMGSVGAFLSLGRRVSTLSVDAMAGAGVHYCEGAIRATAGMAGALLVGLCVKSNVVLGVINESGRGLAFLLVLGCIAGASERLVPNIIKKVEGTLVVDGSDKK